MKNIKNNLLEAFKANVGEWTCSVCNSGGGQPAATFREIKQMGYLFEEVYPNRWAVAKYCPICNAKRSHYKLISVEPLVDKKPRCVISQKQRARVLSLLEFRDAFTGASISSKPEIDHKVPWSRLDKDIDISTLTDEKVKEHFQLLTREHNLLKDRACQYCIKNLKRPPLFGISFWYEGNDTYQGSCVGCGWYDGSTWRMKLNELISR